ncbi:MAG: phenylalanine--tRNA ligase subunit beta [Bacteroidota bacterium]|nr:phenylalanine--tRNA ligase subunit beta [Bacteroidota bacterium]
MKISYKWLNNYIDLKQSPEELAEILTGIGLEIDSIEKYSAYPKSFTDLIVGEIVRVSHHPNADKLRLTEVSIGTDDKLKIVCGASNVALGQKVVVAMPGTTLRPYKGEPFTIQKTKIRGEVSEGMLCAEDEIGLSDNHEGIMVLPENLKAGHSLSQYFPGYEDVIFEIGLTPNRVDAASHIGVARDLAALLNFKVAYPAGADVKNTEPCPVSIEIEDPDGCPRYSGLVIRGVKVQPSPVWLQNYLKAAGLAPINNIVDCTNYVMYEWGQPLHAFDLKYIEGHKIIVKKAGSGSSIITLDGKKRDLAGELIIQNESFAMALAGVFGGQNSGIIDSTTDIFIESAYFSPLSVRYTAKKHGLSTDAAFRYERGTDPNVTVIALKRVAQIIIDIAGGKIEGGIADIYPSPIKEKVIDFSLDELNSIAGTDIPEAEVLKILNAHEMQTISRHENVLRIKVPTYKVDVTRPVDLAEEVLRIYSYDKIPLTRRVKSVLQLDPYSEKEKLLKKLASFLSGHGFYEIFLLSMCKEELLLHDRSQWIEILNPLSRDLAFMRDNLLLPGLQAVQHNLNRKSRNIRFYKWGNVYQRTNDAIIQKKKLAIWWTGDAMEGNWKQKQVPADIFNIIGISRVLLELCGLKEVLIKRKDHEGLTNAARVLFERKPIGIIGQVNAASQKQFGIDQEVFYAELDWETITVAHAQLKIKYASLSRFPRVERDLALIVDENINYSEISKLIGEISFPLLRAINVFDVYKGEQLEKGKKSYAVRMTFENLTQTFDDLQIEKVMKHIVSELKEKLNIYIRS